MTLVVLVVAVAGMTPFSQVAAEEILPNLSWQADTGDEGHTFRYEFTNGSDSIVLNATLTEVTSDTRVYEFWTDVAGDRSTFEYLEFSTRRNLNYTGDSGTNWTFLWVNQTNVQNGWAQIGSENYTNMTKKPLEDKVIFSDEDQSWTYDLDEGWLEKGVDENSPTTWKLESTATLDPATVDFGGTADDYCDEPFEKDSESPGAEQSKYQVRAQICWDGCYAERLAVGQAQLHTTMTTDFEDIRHRIYTNGELVEEENFTEDDVIPPLDRISVWRPDAAHKGGQRSPPVVVDWETRDGIQWSSLDTTKSWSKMEEAFFNAQETVDTKVNLGCA